jgi:hypothetical protein
MRPLLSIKSFSRFLILLLIVQLSVGFFAFPVNQARASGTTYYVDNCVNVGSDSYDGTEQTHTTGNTGPWLTIAKVNASTFNPGDSILFERGCTWREQLTVPSSGNASSSITFGAYGSGAMPEISGATILASGAWSQTTSSAGIIGPSSVSQANTKLSLANGAAFVDLGATINLAQYPAGSQIDICSVTNSSQCVSGYIKAAGTGETYGSELLPDPGMDNLSDFSFVNSTGTILTSGCQSGNCLQLTTTVENGYAIQNFTLSSGILVFGSAYVKAGTETSFCRTYLLDPSYNTMSPVSFPACPSAWTQETYYGTADETSSGFIQIYIRA